MLKDYTITIKTTEGPIYRSVHGYRTSRAALYVVVTEMTSKGGVFNTDGDFFVPLFRIIDLEVTDVRGD